MKWTRGKKKRILNRLASTQSGDEVHLTTVKGSHGHAESATVAGNHCSDDRQTNRLAYGKRPINSDYG